MAAGRPLGPSLQEPPSSPSWTAIARVYDAAIQSGAALRTDTNVLTVTDAATGIDFLVRTSLALQAKAAVPSVPKTRPPDWKNPFLPYDEALWVQHLGPAHTLLLNKFNLVAHHVLVVTRDFQPQEDALNAADLAATHAVVLSMPRGGLAYFNHGRVAGASQPHKHLQVVPLPLDGSEGGTVPPIDPPVRAALTGHPPGHCVELRTLPFQAFGCWLPAGPSGEALADCYQSLLLAARVSASEHASCPYNWLMTPEWMMIVPRRQEYYGPVTVNSLGYAGTFFVRSVEEMDFVQNEGPLTVLAGMARAWDS